LAASRTDDNAKTNKYREPMNPAFYISPSGIVKYIENLPEEPKLCFYFNPNHTFHPHCEHSYNVPCACNEQYSLYLKSVQAAKDSAVEFSDQVGTIKLIRDYELQKGRLATFKPDTIHPFPDQYEVEVELIRECNSDCECTTPCIARKVAVITRQEEESQEELWKKVSNEINDEGLWLYEEWDGFKITPKGIAHLKERFIITPRNNE